MRIYDQNDFYTCWRMLCYCTLSMPNRKVYKIIQYDTLKRL